MKNLKALTVVAVLVAGIGFTSCSNDDKYISPEIDHPIERPEIEHPDLPGAENPIERPGTQNPIEP